MKGSYTLLIKTTETLEKEVGSLGEIRFEPGFYAYNGSAFGPGGLKRVDRHREKSKEGENPHWHIDYLLVADESEIVEVFSSGSDHECSLSDEMKKVFRPIKSFGCSDCNCSSHLFYCSDGESLNKFLEDSYEDQE